MDRHHVCAVDIGFVEKPDDWMPADGKAYVHFYSVVERPPGWSGVASAGVRAVHSSSPVCVVVFFFC